MKKQIIIAAVVAVALGVAGSASAQFGGLGNALKKKAQTAVDKTVDKTTDKAVNKVTGTATGAAAKVSLDVKTTCNCSNGKPAGSCTAMGAEIAAKIRSLEAADEIYASKVKFICDIHDNNIKNARDCSTELRNQWVKMGIKRTTYDWDEGGTDIVCRTRVETM